MLIEQQTVTNPAVTPWFVCHDKTLNQQCMLAQACPPMINHRTSLMAEKAMGGIARVCGCI